MENIKQIAEKLGLTPLALADGTGPDLPGTLQAIFVKLGEITMSLDALRSFLKLHDAPDLDAVTGKIKGMVPAAEKTALETKLAGIEAEKAVAQAFADRKLVEAQRPWAIAYATKDILAFTDFAARQPEVAPKSAAEVLAGTPPADTKPVALTDDEQMIYRKLGLTDAQVAAIQTQKKG